MPDNRRGDRLLHTVPGVVGLVLALVVIADLVILVVGGPGWLLLTAALVCVVIGLAVEGHYAVLRHRRRRASDGEGKHDVW